MNTDPRVRPLETADRPLVEDLLRTNPHKDRQIRFQGLDRDLLARYHRDRILSRIESPDRPVWIFQGKDGGGLVGVSPEKAHSAYFEKNVVQVDPVISYRLRAEEKAALLDFVFDTLVRREARVTWIKTDEAEANLLEPILRHGGTYCGTSIRMSRRLEPLGPAEGESAVTIRDSCPEDVPALTALAAESHRHSRFFRDPHLSEEKKRNLFPRYLEKCLGREDRPCLVAQTEDGTPCGFSLLLCPEGQEKRMGRRIGIVDFTAVNEERQGAGVGGRLLRESLARLFAAGYEWVELKTMLDNLQAVSFYEKNGFRLISAEMYFSIA